MVVNELMQVFELFVALVAAIAAYWQHRQKGRAVEEREEAVVGKTIAEAMRCAAEAHRDDVIAYFDPADDSVTTPPEAVPARSWKMSDETKRWVLSGHDPLNQAGLLRQIGEAEEEKRAPYYLSFQDRGGGYYEIEYGLVKGSGTGKPEKEGV